MKNTYLKLIAILLALVCLLCSCQKEEIDPDKSSKTDKPSSYESEEPEEEEEEEEETEDTSKKEPTQILIGDQQENENYKQITPREISEYKFISFVTDETKEVLCLKVPADWGINKESDSSYLISRNRTEIGRIFLGESSDFNQWQTVASEEEDLNGFNITENIDKFGQGETLKFRYRYSAESVLSDELSVTLTVDYAELSAKAAFYIFKSSSFLSRKDAFNIGNVPEGKNGSILIIGNSFINSSNIGQILTEMMQKNNKSTEITDISRGMATVATYVNDSNLMAEIENGAYDVVFACGLYDSRDEIQNLKTLKSICDSSNTRLVVFPAHNETTTLITHVSQRISSLLVLNWQQELNYLIDDGRDIWDFCENDYYKHSTPLAGYVGAHMIYRAIYGELPKGRLSSSIDQSYVDSMLGDYVTTACAKGTLYTLK